ncbi:MAG TPA: glycosyltransferase, partial [Bryobacteraceae bacterium]
MAELNPGTRALLIIAHAYLPSTASGVQRVLRMVKYLPENGYRPHVICSTREGVLPGIANVTYAPNDFTNQVAAKASRRAERIQRAILPYNDSIPWAPHAAAAAEAFLEKQRHAIVLTTSPPIVSHFAALRLKRRLGVRWVADFRDPLLGNPARSRKWAKIYDSLVQRRFMRNCDAAIAVSDVVFDDWRRRYPQWAAKFHLIWNGFDPEGLVSAAPVPPRSYRVLTHAGTLYTSRFPFWLVESLERLFQRGVVDPSSIKIRLIGHVDGSSTFLEHPAVAAMMAKGCLECDGKQIPRADADRAVVTSD